MSGKIRGMSTVVDLRSALSVIATTYNRGLGTKVGVEAQDFLRRVKTLLLPVPAGLQVVGNGGDGTAAFCPWIGVLDPDTSKM
ncbi:hypothetical protein [Streptomyces sp. SM12]|uniref:hypothetical protein n=1 Tax=Streptomyces sp. SM12 TaxID=1071602 RepID=UPI0011B0C439|nr:hypothetical protein [Streptomyces sp. SM12]